MQGGRSVGQVFGQDSDSEEEEEIPAEARMKMRNVGRETITSAGPNSYGKTRGGFIDEAAMFNREMLQLQEKVSNDKPQTILPTKQPNIPLN